MLHRLLLLLFYQFLRILAKESLVLFPTAQPTFFFPINEYNALYDLYNSTDGKNWYWKNVKFGKKWDFGSIVNPCSESWQGLQCSVVDGIQTITSITLPHFKMKGRLPDSIANFTALTSLILTENNLFGTLSSSIGLLKNLTVLNLGYNRFHGTISHALFECTKLTNLVINANQLVGPIPKNIGNLTLLEILELHDNALTGFLPEELGACVKLKTVFLNNNALSGKIPHSYGNFDADCDLNIAANQLTGLSLFLCELNFYTLNLANNQFNGTIPSCISEMNNLESLYLQGNQLSGSIPASIVTIMPNLRNLDLSYNYLTSSLPSGMFNASSELIELYLQNNMLTGPIPSMNMSVEEFNISYNLFSGSIPEDLCSVKLLYNLDMSYNLLNGTIPPALGQNIFVTSVILSYNALTGVMSNTISTHSPMITLDVNHNQLTGSLPQSFCYNHAEYVDVGNNLFHGSIPDCYNLTGFDGNDLISYTASYNILSGTIPFYLQHENYVVTIAINDNSLTGTLPLFNSTLLNYLYVQGNNLHGPVTILGNHTLLGYLDVSNNQFTGTLPTEFFVAGLAIKSFAATSNCITGSIPEEICSVDSLVFLDLDGLTTAAQCRQSIFPRISSVKTFTLKNQIVGGIPSCLFSMSNLQTLHLSGNSIAWSFPNDGIDVSDSLTDLSLSHNKITGTIPDEIQNRVWTYLDLSFNRLDGTINFVQQNSINSTLVLQVNRLSGALPSTVLSMNSINVLTGNLFDCSLTRDGLPANDEAYSTYQCGSTSFNQASIVWSAFACMTALVITLLLLSHSPWWKQWIVWCESVRIRALVCLAILDEISCSNTLFVFKSSLLHQRNTIIGLTAVIVFVFLPVYGALTHYYRTVQHQYAWTVSAAFISGFVPAIVLLIVFMLFVGSVFLLWFYESEQKAAEAPVGVAGSDAETTKSRLYGLVLVLVVLVNNGVMIVVNALYVYVIVNYSTEVTFCAQVMIALFKLLWNDFAVKALIQMIRTVFNVLIRDSSLMLVERTHEEMPYLAFIVLFNSIIAPCLATAAVDSNCFYNVFIAPSAVSSNFPVFDSTTECTFKKGDVSCQIVSTESVLDVSYDPPFIYSYQCTSSILTNYASVYVFMFLMVAFIKPVVLYVMHRCYTSVPTGSCLHICIDNALYKMLKTKSMQQADHGQILFFKDRFVLRMVGKIAVFITFGVIFPPLAVVVCVAFISEIYLNLLIMGRFLNEVTDESLRSQYRALLSRDVEGCIELLINPLVRLVVPFAAFFYAFFVFDIYGDKVGFRRAIWAPVLLSVTPLMVWLAYIVQEKVRGVFRAKITASRVKSVSLGTELMTMNVLRVKKQLGGEDEEEGSGFDVVA